MMFLLSSLAITTLATLAQAQSLIVVNRCPIPVHLHTQTSFGSIRDNVNIGAGASANLGISSDWDGAVNVGTGCDPSGSRCTTGGPTWDGRTPFSRAEFNFHVRGLVTYDISLIYGYNVGMKISSADASCDAFACTISSGCPIPGPGGSCYSSCCTSASDCQKRGALPPGGGGCVRNAGPGPHSAFYNGVCFNAYAFPDNDGAAGFKPANFVDFNCRNTAITLTLCPGTTSNFHH